MRALAAAGAAGAVALAASLACVTIATTGVSLERAATSALPKPGEYLLVKPPSFNREPRRRYPVLYFLHDGYGDVLTLERRGVAAQLTARMRAGKLPEFLVVAPGAPGSWFSDTADGSKRYEAFIAGDLVRAIEATGRAVPGPGSRGITGISMGGYGAFKIALKRPGFYGSVSALSGALIPFGADDLKRYNAFSRWTITRVFGKPDGGNTLAENDVWEMLRGPRFESPPFVSHLRAGTEDDYRLDRVAAQYGMYLNEHGAPTTVVLEPGRHDWDYWRPAMTSIAEWHASQFAYDSER
ncbi:MAG: alpha/beta hydrolase [Thermoanaerobaculia bacterium]